MKALLCKQYGPPESLVLEEVASPQPAAGEVLIRVRAASVNYPDVLVIRNKYQVKPPLPFAPGSELAGVVKAVGPGVARVRPGDAVIAVTTWGAFAEECVAPEARVVPLPEGMDFETGASLLLAYGTAQHALCHRVAAAPGEWLLVLGAAGGVGLAAIEIGRLLGLRVIACASSAAKLELCRSRGAEATIDYAREDLRERIKAITSGAGVDVVYDPVGGALTEAALRSSAWRARLLVIGFAGGDIPRIPLNLPLLMERSLIGVYWGEWARRAPEEFVAAVRELGEWHAAGRIRPYLSARYPLARAAEALAEMAARRVLGKVVVTMDAR